MKPIVIYSDKILKFISLLFPVGGIFIFPFIILRKKYKILPIGKVIINHESIHFQQCLETLILGFYLIYPIEFLIKLIKYKNISEAYLNIGFEKEAFDNEDNLNYLQTRKKYSWLS